MRRFRAPCLAVAMLAVCSQVLGQTPVDAQAARLRAICLSPQFQAALGSDTRSLMVIALINDKTGGPEPIDYKWERQHSKLSEAEFREWVRTTQAVYAARAALIGLNENQMKSAIVDYGTKACLK